MLRIAVTYAIAIASFVFVERPVRARSKPLWRGRRLAVTAIGTVVAVLVAFVVTTGSGSSGSRGARRARRRATGPTQPLVGPTAPATTPLGRFYAAITAERAVTGPRFDHLLQADGLPLDDNEIFAPGLDRPTVDRTS